MIIDTRIPDPDIPADVRDGLNELTELLNAKLITHRNIGRLIDMTGTSNEEGLVRDPFYKDHVRRIRVLDRHPHLRRENVHTAALVDARREGVVPTAIAQDTRSAVEKAIG